MLFSLRARERDYGEQETPAAGPLGRPLNTEQNGVQRLDADP